MRRIAIFILGYFCVVFAWPVSAGRQLVQAGLIYQIDEDLIVWKGRSSPLYGEVGPLLEQFMRSPGRAFSKQELLQSLGCQDRLRKGLLDQKIAVLRGILNAVGAFGLIETLTSFGFRFYETSRQQEIRHALARTQSKSNVKFWGPYVIDGYRQSVFVKQQELKLTGLQRAIFQLLAEHRGQSLAFNAIQREIADQGFECAAGSINPSLRKISQAMGRYKHLLLRADLQAVLAGDEDPLVLSLEGH